MANSGKHTGKKNKNRKAKEAAYWSSGQNIKNKVKKLKKHIKRLPNDSSAVKALEKIT